MTLEKISDDIEIKIFNVDDIDDLINGKKLIDKYLLINKIIEEETNIVTFLNEIVNIAHYIYIDNILSDNSTSVSFDIKKFDGIYMFVSEQNSAYQSLLSHLKNIHFDMNKVKPFSPDDMQSYILRMNNKTYLFNE